MRFCTAKATHIFFSKKIQHICVSLDVNFNESLTNDVVSFEQPGPDIYHIKMSDFLLFVDTPQGVLPILDVDGKIRLSQSFAIARFVAREVGK